MSSNLSTNSIILQRFGSCDHLVVEQRPLKNLNSNEIQLEIKACGLNFADLYTIQGLFQTKNATKPPFVMGREAAGLIVNVGQGVKDFKVGDRVVCISNKLGLWTEIACVDPQDCILLPDEMPYQDAAAFFINYLTAYCSLFDFGNLRPSQTVFIHSIAGGVGCAATQLAKTVTGTKIVGTASQAKHQTLKTMHNFDCLIDSANKNYVEEVLSKFPEGVDIVLDNRSGGDFTNGRKMLGQMGKIIHLGANNVFQGQQWSTLKLIKTWWDLKNISVLDLVMSNQSICGFNLDELREKCPKIYHKAAEEVKFLYTEGKIRPTVDKICIFSKISEAINCFAMGNNIGKIVLIPK